VTEASALPQDTLNNTLNDARAPKPVKKRGEPQRSCIVTREAQPKSGLIRFVVGPDGSLVPDLKGNLPGRGCWVSSEAAIVAQAIKRKAFGRALKDDVVVADTLVDDLDRLLTKNALGALGLARKAGVILTGAAKVEDAIRSGKASFSLHATDGAEDGIRKMSQARRAVLGLHEVTIDAFSLFTSSELSLALGGDNVIHAAGLYGPTTTSARDKCFALARYRGKGRLDEE
jgi:uncharacterized protein